MYFLLEHIFQIEHGEERIMKHPHRRMLRRTYQ
jgi:hypothetical protein